MEAHSLTQVVFGLSLLITLGIAIRARQIGRNLGDDDIGGRSLNRWLIGLSAGATANSGFVVTGAVGLGYLYGLQWIALPIAWFLGDLIFWKYFPDRLNAFGRESGAITISQVLRHGLGGRLARAASLMAAIVLIAGLGGYTVAQWLAGQKFMTGAFGISPSLALSSFALYIIIYSSIGGFRGSVYVDAFQAIVRVVGVVLVLGTSLWIAATTPGLWESLRGDASLFRMVPSSTVAGAIGFVLGWAAASVGFGLGQPQIFTRYLAGRSPEETKAAKWVYISFVQLTWITMTFFGLLLRGIMPGLEDPEAGLSAFVRTHLNAIAAGIVLADVFGVIASTSNGLLLSMAQCIKHDVLALIYPSRARDMRLGLIVLAAGIVTMTMSLVADTSVASLALVSVSVVGAGVAVPVMIKIMHWRHSSGSLFASVIAGVGSAIAWSHFGLSSVMPEAAVGMFMSALANWGVLLLQRRDLAAQSAKKESS